MRVIFMGTPEFAVPSLNTLHESRHSIPGVVTVPDRASGRGQKPRPSAVKMRALELDLPVYQPEQLDDPDFLEDMRSLEPDLMVVVAFRILPEACYTIPAYHAINLHASLLPQYRGAAPIQRALMAGEDETGVTTFFLKPTVDTGDILLQEAISVGPDENAGSVHDRLADLGADVVLRTVNAIGNDEIEPVPQSDEKATPAPKITREDCRIDWEQSVIAVHNQIRALSPYPGAFTFWDDMQLKIYRGNPTDRPDDNLPAPGSVIEADNIIKVVCSGGVYEIQTIQPQGKRRMDVADFLNGYALRAGERFY